METNRARRMSNTVPLSTWHWPAERVDRGQDPPAALCKRRELGKIVPLSTWNVTPCGENAWRLSSSNHFGW
jgi:hypothetical protein